jgi:hypothetical protein
MQSIRSPSQMQSARQSPAPALSLTPVHGSAITSVMGGSASLGGLPVRPGGLARAGLVAGWVAC